ncbi:MAG: D-amino-acid transaminase [Pseudomonadota bacterium]
MSRTVYINGQYCAEQDATVSIFDRGLLFADAIYEVAGVIDGRLLDFEAHMQRLDRSLDEMRMPAPLSHDEILAIMREMVRLNDVTEGLVYLQITRGSDGDREFLAKEGIKPTVFMFTQQKVASERDDYQNGISMVSAPDIRWARRDIKTVGLMGSVMSKWVAQAANAGEVLMLKDGYVTEGGCTSFYIIKSGKLITRPLSNDILPGCTRKALLSLVAESDIELDERLFTLEETYTADEAFITGASTYVCPVIRIDGRSMGDEKPGPVTRRLQEIYYAHALKDSI